MANFLDIKEEDCIKKVIPNEVTLNNTKTIVLQSVINQIKEHGRSSMCKEVCGVLIGNLCFDKEPYLFIDAAIEGKFAAHEAGSVTFTSETWDFIHEELARNYPAKRIVGWYHTHPGFGIFLSNMDLFIHENFFPLKWQVAYVFDPQVESDGFFFWEDENIIQDKVVVFEDEKPNVKKIKYEKNSKINIVVEEEDNNYIDDGVKKDRDIKKCCLTIFNQSNLVIFLVIISLCLGFFIFYLLKEHSTKESNFVKEKENLQNEYLIIYKEKENRYLEEKDQLIKNYRTKLQYFNDLLKTQEQTIKKLKLEINSLKKNETMRSNKIKELTRSIEAISNQNQLFKKEIITLREKIQKIENKKIIIVEKSAKTNSLNKTIDVKPQNDVKKEVSKPIKKESSKPSKSPKTPQSKQKLQKQEKSFWSLLLPWNWF